MTGKQHGAVLLVTAALALLAYWPFLHLPLISDDYVHIDVARRYVPVSGWSQHWDDVLYRSRATSSFLGYGIYSLFGLNPLAYHISNLLLHILCCWMIYALGAWHPIGWRIAAAASCYFAVQEGHQEAVVWFAAVHDVLVCLFVLLTLYLWLHWARASTHRLIFYAATLIAYLIALFSKESAVAAVPLMAVVLPWNRDNWKRQLLSLSPFAILAIAYVAPIFAADNTHLHLNDGTFSLSAPFWIVIPRSIWRMLWFWGLLGVLVLAGWKHHPRSRLLWIAFAWMVIGLLPYSFLLYMPYVPSRHTYPASVGLAILVGAAWVAARERFLAKQWAAAALAALIIAHNCGYLWTRKLDQFARRAEPTERLIGFASRITEPGPVYLSCYPFPFETAVQAVKLRVGTHLSPVPTRPGQPVPPGRHLSYCVDGKEPKI